MDKLKILTVGAGHGGLIAAAKLASEGYDVTVYEACKREELGHDAEDRFSFSLLKELIGVDEKDFPKGSWRVRGDAAFLSPKQRTKIVVNYNEENAQKIMWRKPLINLLIDYAINAGVKFSFGENVLLPLTDGVKVIGIQTEKSKIYGDLVIDAAGVFSPIRCNLPDAFGIEKLPKYGDLFYSYRAYFSATENHKTDTPFEVYLYHEGEKGLSWFCTGKDFADVLIGRIYQLTDEKIAEQLALFRSKHPWMGKSIVHGGARCVIPVRRPLTLMISDGYCAVGDSAFMTTPMNGMGIDISMIAGAMLADAIIIAGDVTPQTLWNYNSNFHRYIGGSIAKNEGLKNALLSLPAEGVDFLFDSGVIQASDLAGAGKKTSFTSLMGKFFRGIKAPKYFFPLLKGIFFGAVTSLLYKSVPSAYSTARIKKWSERIAKFDVVIPKEK